MMGSYVVRQRMNSTMWGGGVRLQGILHMPGLPGLLLQCTCSLSGLNVACEYAHACRRACTLVANVVFLLSQHDCHVLCWARVESERLISLVGWDRCNLLVLSSARTASVQCLATGASVSWATPTSGDTCWL